MVGKDLNYCRGCGHLGKGNTCDYLLHVGHSRGCPPGVGCPMHTGKSAKRCRRQMQRADFEEAAGELPAKAGKATSAATVGTKQAKKQPDVSPFDELRAMQLYSDGLDDIAMADALGITAKRVQNWRLRMHLKRPRGGKKKTEKEQEMKKEASDSQVSKPVETKDIPESAAEMQQKQSSKSEPDGVPMTAGLLRKICERIEDAGLGDLPLRINGGNVKDFTEISIKKTADGAVIDMKN